MKPDNSIQPLTTADIGQLIANQIDLDQIAIPSWQFSTLDSNSSGLYNTTIHPNISIAPNTAGIAPNSVGTGSIGGIAGTYHSQGVFDFDQMNEQRIEQIVKKNLKSINDRLAILDTPDQRVLDKFEALKMAYDHYRMLEALMHTEIQKVKESK